MLLDNRSDGAYPQPIEYRGTNTTTCCTHKTIRFGYEVALSNEFLVIFKDLGVRLHSQTPYQPRNPMKKPPKTLTGELSPEHWLYKLKDCFIPHTFKAPTPTRNTQHD